MSSIEVEFIAASKISQEAAWLEKLTDGLNESYESLLVLYYDNPNVSDLIHDYKFHSKAKLLDQTMYGLRIIELVITKESNYRGVLWNEVFTESALNRIRK